MERRPVLGLIDHPVMQQGERNGRIGFQHLHAYPRQEELIQTDPGSNIRPSTFGVIRVARNKLLVLVHLGDGAQQQLLPFRLAFLLPPIDDGVSVGGQSLHQVGPPLLDVFDKRTGDLFGVMIGNFTNIEERGCFRLLFHGVEAISAVRTFARRLVDRVRIYITGKERWAFTFRRLGLRII